MKDPFPPPPQILADATTSLLHSLNLDLPTLTLHIHEVIVVFLTYQVLFYLVSPIISTFLVPKTYRSLAPAKKISWDAHVTSLVQSTFMTSLALHVIWADKERAAMDSEARIWGYTGATGFVQACALGYFLWDLGISVMYFETFGVGSLVHALSALLITGLGFRPFANYYGLNFILYEMSTPFLNIHWFLDKLNMTGSQLQFYNGVALMSSFFGARIVWGNYQSIRIYTDVWAAMTTPASTSSEKHGALPMWLAILYLGSNTALNVLNVYWFSKMVKTMRKRFEPPAEEKKNN